MKICVLGAGFIGITTAYLLAKEGHEVTVVERHHGAGEECSFSNGAQLSYCHAEPWAGFKTLKNGISWLGQNDKPLLFRFRKDLQMWEWLLRFLMNCNSRSSQINTEKILKLGLYSREVLHKMSSGFDFNFDHTKGGKLFIFENEEDYKTYLKQARIQELLGSRYQVLSENEALAYEPALQNYAHRVSGYIRDPLDESADGYKFCIGLNSMLEKMPNVKLLYDNEIKDVTLEGNNIAKISTDKNEVKADLFVLCLGAYSYQFVKKIGIKLPIYPIKGYSITVDIKDDKRSPQNSITNYFEKIVFSKIGNNLRVAGTAEFAGYDHSIFQPRIDMLKNSLIKHFPNCGEIEEASAWACLRPSTPDSVPIIGRSRFDNLLFNTGHGTLGWTQNFSSAQLISDIVAERKTELNMDWYSANRF